ncbi:tRNA-specific adenosine deaminase subunit TAD2 [Golovinomyces cichoracearum]|uniref:tRNA-specific adenosine deaminase subunit TAD2 n=1 Tax=Golovinomyces cichoracearum TaxID=62708 RepID=A0A420IKK5_9PEZI|nr:tRNA-specific adenosine deaminase subunit TAD2 [Golovinomyces cichoracearum]
MPLDPYPSPSMSDGDRIVHLEFMRNAIAMAQIALENSETPVGCVIVHNNQIISRGMNGTNQSFNGTRHAEFVALNNYISRNGFHIIDSGVEESNRTSGVGDDSSSTQRRIREDSLGILTNCTLYVTVEPCIMCASLLRQVGIRRVFFGAWNEKFGGTGGVLDVHKIAGSLKDSSSQKGDYEVSGGWLREEAILLLRRFYLQENERAPEPRDKGKRIFNPIVSDIIDISDHT